MKVKGTDLDETTNGQLTKFIAGDPGTEGTTITVGGVSYDSELKVSDLGDTRNADLLLHRHSTTVPITVGATRSNSNDSTHSAVTSGQRLLDVFSAGWDGTDYEISSRISLTVDAAVANNDVPGRITFHTATGGTLTERLRINSSGAFGIGGANFGTSGQVIISAGSAAAPAWGQLGTAGISDDSVTYAKMQNVSATDKVLGRSTAGAGDIEEITCTAAGRALLDDTSASAQKTTLGVGTGDAPQFAGLLVNTATIPSGASTVFLASGATDPAAALLSSDLWVFGHDDVAGAAGLVASSASPADRFTFKGTRAGGTLDTPTAAASGDLVFSLLGSIYDGVTTRVTGAIEFTVDGAVSSAVAPQRISFLTGATSSRTERVRIGSSGNTYFPGVGTTASAANAFLNSGSSPVNELLRSTSSIKYKKDVEDIWHDNADCIYSLRPVYYRSMAKADRQDWAYYGLIAEEVAAVDSRLVHWGYHDDDYETVREDDGVERVRLRDGAQLKPDGVQYERLCVLLIDVIKRLEQRITALEIEKEKP